MPDRAVLDTSVLVRYLTNDDPVKAVATQRLLDAHLGDELLLPSVALAELSLVLLRVYRWPVSLVASAVRAVVTHPAIEVPEATIWLDVADDLESGHGLVDAYLMRTAAVAVISTLLTFDRAIRPLPGVICRVP